MGCDGKLFFMSMKDLCTLELLPDIIEAGVSSLKIEGRMKSPRYTAGVVSMYRKYVDRYLAGGREGYKVEAGDKAMLLDLFDRGGFTDGYYKQHNGKNMIALQAKPAFREGNQTLFDDLDREYVEKKKQEPVQGTVILEAGKPAKLQLVLGELGQEADLAVAVVGETVQMAQNQPLSEDRLRNQMNKTGNSPFYFSELNTIITGSCFMPVQALNELRRTGMEQLKDEVIGRFRRPKPLMSEAAMEVAPLAGETISEQPAKGQKMALHVSLETPDSLASVIAHPEVQSIYIDAAGFAADRWRTVVEECHQAGKQSVLMLPYIFRAEAEQYFYQHKQELLKAGFDEVLVRSLEEVDFMQEQGISLPMVFDSGVYSMNHLAAMEMKRLGAKRLTLPLELNHRELKALGCADAELIGYGYLPAMITAQCVVKTTAGCKKTPQLLMMKDRTGKELPVKNHCRFCYNTIYNPSPLSLLGQEALVQQLNPAVLRLQFTIETAKQVSQVLDAYVAEFKNFFPGQTLPFKDFTRGHMKRGVE